MSVKTGNQVEEIQEIVEKCTKCGMCKAVCPVFSAILEESSSPRGKMLLLNSNIYDKLLYDCTLCKACELRCMSKIGICEAIRKARQVLAENNKELKESKEMISNIKEYGNPFGKEPEKSKKLYCC
jgi:glycolate oxidase iron-sulfur subunit